MTATPNFASDARSLGAADAAAPAGNAGPFVLNLCSSTTPMALAQTDLPELKRFNFFVSRRFEEGRERFRLHMGYFATLAEAEEWLNVVREIYPGAWAGEAPGRKLRERAAAEQAAQAAQAAGPQQQVSARAPAAPVRAAPAASPPAPPESLALRVPVLKAAPAAPVARPAAPRTEAAKPAAAKPAAAKPAAPAAAPAPNVMSRAPTRPAAPPPGAALAPRAPAGSSAAAAAQNLLDAAPAPVRGPSVPVPKPAAAAPAATATQNPRGVFADSNVREVLQALGDASATGQTRLMRAPPPPAPKVAPSAAANDISDTQVLRLLETRRDVSADAAGAESAPAQDPAHGAIPLLKPDDTGTREALKSAVTSNAPVLFAVQLQWSVQQVELDKVPPLAIFSAYTLYTVEGSRDGRKWFGLRLGFFSDAISAKQVAHYVRSEFTAVAVVPVSSQEKARATDQDRQAATVGAPASVPAGPVDEFKLIDDEPAREEMAKLATRTAAAPQPPAKPGAEGAARKIPGRPIPKVAVGRAVVQEQRTAPVPAPAAAKQRPPQRGAGKVGARDKRGPQSLEETLEILGASQLSIDNGKGETLNESGVRHLRVEVQKNSPFSKLLERLSERMKKS
jgi:hypothetical protein